MVQIDCRNQILPSFIMYSIQLTHHFWTLSLWRNKNGKDTVCEAITLQRFSDD